MNGHKQVAMEAQVREAWLDKAREQAPVLLEELRAVQPRRAEWIEDVYSEVLRGLRQNDVKDPVMVEWLMEALRHDS